MQQLSSMPENHILNLLNQNKTAPVLSLSPNKPKFLTAQELEEQQLNNNKSETTNIFDKLLSKQQEKQKFPTVIPQENPFYNIFNKNHENQLNQTINNALNQILKSSSSSSSSSASSTAPSSSSTSANSSPLKQQDEQSVENIFSKLKLVNQNILLQQSKMQTNSKEHFNLLLNKLKQPQQTSPSIEETSSILKWFEPSPKQQQLKIENC